MPYQNEWGSNHPGHLVFLLDLSSSMEHFERIDYLLSALKECCEELVAKCEDLLEIKNRFSMTIIGYNTDVITLWKGNTQELDEFINQKGNESLFDKNGEAKPKWQTYTAKAFRMVKADIEEWIASQNHIEQMPVPLIIHVTDGYPEENERDNDMARADALRAAQEIMGISIPDGNPLLFNIHIGKRTDTQVLFPSKRPDDARQQFLYDASSEMPEAFIKSGREADYSTIEKGSRFMVSNLQNPADIARLITWGSSLVLDSHTEPAKPNS